MLKYLKNCIYSSTVHVMKKKHVNAFKKSNNEFKREIFLFTGSRTSRILEITMVMMRMMLMGAAMKMKR